MKEAAEIVPVSRLRRSLSDPPRSCLFLVYFFIYMQPSIPNPSMWGRADRRHERPAIARRDAAT